MLPHSDLVQESKLETYFSSNYTQHIYYKRGTSGRDRRVRLKEKWKRQRRLGQGAYGTVWLETCEKPAKTDGRTVRAVKEIPIASTTADEIDYHLELEAIMKFSQQRYLPSFVESFGWYDSPEAIFITMEYVANGDLQKYLTRPIPEEETKMIAYQLAEGLQYMHLNGFTHRDLKPGNILVVCEGPQWLVQISDFGISRRLRPEQSTLGTMRKGTMGFIAPEMLGFVLERDCPHAIDIWSLGTVIFRILTKELFLTDLAVLQKYCSGEHPFPEEKLDSVNTSTALKQLLGLLLAPSPRRRPLVSEILRHESLESAAGNRENQSTSGSTTSDDFDSDGSGVDEGTEDIPSAAWSTNSLPNKRIEKLPKFEGVLQRDLSRDLNGNTLRNLATDSVVKMAEDRSAQDKKARHVNIQTQASRDSESPTPTSFFIVDNQGTTYHVNPHLSELDNEQGSPIIASKDSESSLDSSFKFLGSGSRRPSSGDQASLKHEQSLFNENELRERHLPNYFYTSAPGTSYFDDRPTAQRGRSRHEKCGSFQHEENRSRYPMAFSDLHINTPPKQSVRNDFVKAWMSAGTEGLSTYLDGWIFHETEIRNESVVSKIDPDERLEPWESTNHLKAVRASNRGREALDDTPAPEYIPLSQVRSSILRTKTFGLVAKLSNPVSPYARSFALSNYLHRDELSVCRSTFSSMKKLAELLNVLQMLERHIYIMHGLGPTDDGITLLNGHMYVIEDLRADFAKLLVSSDESFGMYVDTFTGALSYELDDSTLIDDPCQAIAAALFNDEGPKPQTAGFIQNIKEYLERCRTEPILDRGLPTRDSEGY